MADFGGFLPYFFGFNFWHENMAEMTPKWHQVGKIKSWRSKSGLIFSILATVRPLSPSDFSGPLGHNIWDHCAQWSASVKVAGAVGCLQTAESLSG